VGLVCLIDGGGVLLIQLDDPDLEYLLAGANALGDLCNEVVLIGGSVAGPLLTDPVAERRGWANLCAVPPGGHVASGATGSSRRLVVCTYLPCAKRTLSYACLGRTEATSWEALELKSLL
jgi:hypothetical protein